MRFVSFEIENFKGIEHAKVDLIPSGAGVFTLIGLNESGKTTVLEAISKFRPDEERTEALYGSSSSEAPPTSFVPKQKKSNFTGDIAIKAVLKFDEGELAELITRIENSHDIEFDRDSISEEFSVRRVFTFESSDFKRVTNYWFLKVRSKTRRATIFREHWITATQVAPLFREIQTLVPRIVYFPTFLFSFPEKIILNPQQLDEEETDVNRLYRKIIQDIADALENPLNVEKHIVDRILKDESMVDRFFSIMSLSADKQQQVNAAMSEISAHVTNTVFEYWGKIFGGDFSGREIVVRPGIERSDEGNQVVFLQFLLRDGASQYELTERSLGFRWFFSFLMFTLYRVFSKGRGPTLFLLDEPASNLHSRAQMMLLDSFPKIASGSNMVIYSTHSHYMVNPAWLDQAFIVSNAAVDYNSVDEANKFVRSMANKVTVERYRNFVGKNPDKMTYFQPVLDKLDFSPSRLDLVRPSLLFEGKGDYLIVEYARSVILGRSTALAIVPTRGATGIYELVGLFLGWGVPFKVCLDADREGKKTKKELIENWALSNEEVFCLDDADPALANSSLDEMLAESDIEMVREHFRLDAPPTKSQIHLFFSEMLARREKVPLSEILVERVQAILKRAEFDERHAESLG